jgi:hypothetical protein
MIKSHHNVGGLPKRMKFELLEPLRTLFKDEVREVGTQLGLPREIVWSQPFPGPGLAVRILGAVNPERLRILQDADWIVIEEMKKADLYYKIWQTFAVLLPVKTVGVMGDERTYDNVVAIRAVESVDGMTADWVRFYHAGRPSGCYFGVWAGSAGRISRTGPRGRLPVKYSTVISTGGPIDANRPIALRPPRRARQALYRGKPYLSLGCGVRPPHRCRWPL